MTRANLRRCHEYHIPRTNTVFHISNGRGTEHYGPQRMDGSPHKLRSVRNKSTSERSCSSVVIEFQSTIHPSTASMSKIVRLTLFKLSDATVIKETIQKYSTLTQDAVKVRSCVASICTSDVPSPPQLHSKSPASRSLHTRLIIPALRAAW